MAIYTILSSLAVIFALAVPGVVFQKLKMADQHQLKLMSGFMMKVILPAVIIYSMQTDFSPEMLKSGIKVFAAVFGLFGIVIIFSAVFARVLGMNRKYFGIIAFILFFANTGGIGIPVMNMLFGSEAVFYASVAEMATDVLIFTAGVLLMKSSGNAEGGIDLKALISPGTFSIIIGLVLFLFDIRLPEIINNILDKISGASLPVTMFVIGAQIAAVDMKILKSNWRVFIVTLAKLLVVPVFMYVLAVFVLKCNSLSAGVLTILYAMPTGGAAAIFAQEYGADTQFAASAVFLTDVLCLITLPIIAVII